MDAGVLIAAARGTDPESEAAMAILDDPDRVFASSVFVWLEVMPKALHHGRVAEVEFYERFFRDARQPSSLDSVIEIAKDEARTHGLGAVDSLHIGAGVAVGAEELVTLEGPTKPIHRTRRLAVRTLLVRGGKTRR